MMKAPVSIATAVTGLAIAELEPPPGGGGFTSYQSDGAPTHIAVPSSASDADLAVRCHEYGHLLLREVQNSLDHTKYPNAVLQAVLDVHTNQYMLAHGVPAVGYLPLHEPGRVRDKSVNLVDRILTAYRSYGLLNPPPTRLARPLRKRVVACQRIAARAVTAADLERACEELTRILTQPEPPPPPPRPGGRARVDPSGNPSGEPGRTPPPPEPSDGPVDCPTNPYPAPSPLNPKELNRILQRLAKREIERFGKKPKPPKNSEHPLQGVEIDPKNPQWMTMEIRQPTLNRRLRQARDYGRASKPSWSDGPFRFPLRALPGGVGDGRVFGSVQRGKRGTVLIDFSGSMDLEPHHIVEILAACPRMMVATYCGCASKNHGVLTVLARHGRIAADEAVSAYGQNNGVDGPALHWLARQPAPRYWISDGQVNGLGGKYSPLLWQECEAICRAHSIRRFFNLEDFLQR